jgi:uncharacterized protein YbaP (TraB family)
MRGNLVSDAFDKYGQQQLVLLSHMITKRQAGAITSTLAHGHQQDRLIRCAYLWNATHDVRRLARNEE